MPDRFALLAVSRRNNRTDWPQPETELNPREGWVLGSINVSTREGMLAVDALIRDKLAVHRMVERGSLDEGFAISPAATGLRITVGARVFASSDAACRVAESVGDEILRFADCCHSEQDRLALCAAFEAADDRGEILRDLVYVA